MAHYIVSTASAPMVYCIYEQGRNTNNPRVIRKIRIEGYANVKNPNAARNVYAPRCAITEISDEDWGYLQKNPSFLHHQEKGFMRHSDVNTEKVVDQGMTKRDRSAQIDDWDFAQGKDERFSAAEGMGTSWAKAGLNDSMKGQKGFQFVDE